MNKTLHLVTGLLLCLLVSGCAAPEREPEKVLPTPKNVVLNEAASLSGRTPLNLTVSVFRAEEKDSSSLYSPRSQLRSVEKRYLPYRLKETLDSSGFWGAVRVMPDRDPNAELNMTGQVLFSDGVELKLQVTVTDATGLTWIDGVYTDVASEKDYSSDPNYQVDPFQDLYNRIANDLAAQLTGMTPEAYELLLNVATLRYASELSPETFERYLARQDDRFVITGLPARDDPLFEKVMRIRDSEYLFADSVDAHFESLHQRLGPTYAWWRHYSYELTQGNRRLEQVDATRGATKGTWYAMERVYKTYKESKMNEDALRELTESFDRETEPLVAEVAGGIVRLTGTLDRQYEQWRALLRELYRAETGD